MSSQCDAVGKRAVAILGCINRGGFGREGLDGLFFVSMACFSLKFLFQYT